MPSKSKSQQKLFCMAWAVRKGELDRNKVSDEVLKIADSDMSDKEIKEFMVLKEGISGERFRHLSEFIKYSL